MILSSWTQFILFLLGLVSLLIVSIPGNVQMGTFFFDSFQYDKAFDYYATALKDDGSNLKNLKRLKDYYLVMGDTKKALELQESLVKLKPRNRSYLKSLQSLYDWNRMPYEKLQSLEKEALLFNDKDKGQVLLEVAEGYRWLRRYEDANRVYEKLLERGGREILDSAMTFYASTGQRDKVEELARKHKSLSDPLIYLRWMAELAEADGDFDLALRRYREILGDSKPFIESQLLEMNPEKLRPKLMYLERLNRNLLRLGRIEESLKLQHDLSELYPENLTLAYDMAYFYLQQERPGDAFAVFRKLESKEKNPERRFDLCSVYGTLGRERETNRCLQSLTKSYPDNPRYLEGLAESYERLGNKQEALRVFEKILDLQGERDASLWRSQDLILLAQNGPFETRNLRKRRLSEEKLSEDKLDELRQRVIFLREELGEGRKSEKLMLTLVKRHPRNLNYLKQLAYHYLDHGQKSEGTEVMERVLRIDPKDPDALRVILGRDAEEGRHGEVYEKLKLLEPLKEFQLVELRFNNLLALNKSGEFRDFCLARSLEFREIKIRCEYELGDKKVAIREMKEFIEAEKKDELRPMLASWYLEAEELEEAEKEINWLAEKQSFQTTDLRKALEDLRELLRSRREWLLSGNMVQVVQTNSSYLISEIDLLKKLAGPGVGVRLDSLQGANPFALVSPYLFYGTNSAQFKIGPTLNLSDRKLDSPFFADASFFGSERFFGNIHFENSRPEYAVRDLQRSDKARRRFLSGYGSYRGDKSFSELALTRNEYRYDNERGEDYQVFAEHLRTGVFHPRWSFGARAFLINLSGSGETINNLHIQKGLGYYAVAQYANSFLKNNFGHWNYLIKVAVGGDTEREIGFGEALNGRAQLEYFKTEKKGLRLFVEHYKESYLARINDMSLFGIQFLTNF